MSSSTSTENKSESLPSIVFILDASGSMQVLGDAPCSTFNEFIEEQKKVLGDFKATLILFNSDTKLVYKNLDSKDIKNLTSDVYVPDYMTALYDAIGFGIETQKETGNDKVVFVILTDGDENSSRIYKKNDIKKNIKEMESRGWKFMYLGANQDAFLVGNDMGISKTETFEYSAVGLSNVMRSISADVSTSFLMPDFGNICLKSNTIVSSDPFQPFKSHKRIRFEDAKFPVNFSTKFLTSSYVEESNIFIAKKNHMEFEEIVPSTFFTKKSCEDWKCMICKKNTTLECNMFEINVAKKSVMSCQTCLFSKKFEDIFSNFESIRNNIENWLFIDGLDDEPARKKSSIIRVEINED